MHGRNPTAHTLPQCPHAAGNPDQMGLYAAAVSRNSRSKSVHVHAALNKEAECAQGGASQMVRVGSKTHLISESPRPLASLPFALHPHAPLSRRAALVSQPV